MRYYKFACMPTVEPRIVRDLQQLELPHCTKHLGPWCPSVLATVVWSASDDPRKDTLIQLKFTNYDPVTELSVYNGLRDASLIGGFDHDMLEQLHATLP